MIINPRDKEPATKQEGGNRDDNPLASSRLWSGLRNPRIVRVSRLFGGKDRHSKVSTVRGLRDRRVRLSVPTAIQLYDLQDRLGLGQPSKVVDWLLNAAQHEIDKLPPLQIPPQGNFVQSPHESSFSFKVAQLSPVSCNPSAFENSKYLTGVGACSLALSSGEACNEEIYNNDAAAAADLGTLPKTTYWNLDVPQGGKLKEARSEVSIAKGNINAEVDEVGNEGVGIHGIQVLAHASLPRVGNSSISGLLNSSTPYASFYQWDPSNAYISHSESHSSEAERLNICSSTSVSSSQLVCYPCGAVPSVIPSYLAASSELDKRQLDHFHMTTSASQNLSLNSLRTPDQFDGTTMRFFQSSLAPKQHHSQNPHGS